MYCLVYLSIYMSIHPSILNCKKESTIVRYQNVLRLSGDNKTSKNMKRSKIQNCSFIHHVQNCSNLLVFVSKELLRLLGKSNSLSIMAIKLSCYQMI